MLHSNIKVKQPILSQSQFDLPRSVKVKNLTPQEKVKEWIQTLPLTRTATNEAILVISKIQMQVQLTIWSSYSFTLGWQVNDRHSCKGDSPSLSFPYRGTSKTVIQENITTPSDSCVRGTLSSPPHTRWCHMEVEGFVYMTCWPRHNMRKLVVPFWTLKLVLFHFISVLYA